MHLDAVDLKDFYACPLGIVARRLLGTRLRARWSDLKSCRTFGLGFATPYLAAFRGEAEPSPKVRQALSSPKRARMRAPSSRRTTSPRGQV